MKHVRYVEGKFSVWCDITNSLVLKDATRQDVIDYFISIASKRAQDAAIMLCEESRSKVVH
jgi:hypothetical protein